MSMLLGHNIFKENLDDLNFLYVRLINTINPHSYCISKKDKQFENALKASDILLPDGIGIVWAERMLNGNRINKIAGYDVFMFLMKKADTDSAKVFFLGASQDTLNKIATRAKQDFPNVTVFNFAPPYKTIFTKEDSEFMCAKVNAIQPDILFVGMTAPKQEKWVFENKDSIIANTICSIGAVFDFYAGTVKRPSNFWISLGLEWLPRLLQEPKRLAKRNFVSTPKFILEVLWFKLFGKGIL
ncbi:WecB/TagA/CpsF family glycosyltransferase [Winogradskyella sp. A2]|uniref:WecB/TagA/CpsF family glycosyltransferase n=1 Tax=Winogradskyella sp. A2 TaxID=3366944 RepID=UPI00398C3DC8